MITSFTLTLALLAGVAQESTPSTTALQREEALGHLVEAMVTTHPNLFYGVTEEEFLEAQYAVQDHFEDWSDDQFVVGLMRLLACVSVRAGRDGHAGIFAFDHWHSLPLAFHAFSDGWHVLDAMEPHEALAGARVVALDGLPIEQVTDRLSPLLARENEHDLLNKLPRLLVTPEVLHAVGIGKTGSAIRLDLEVNGEPRSVVLAGESLRKVMTWRQGLGVPLPRDTETLWLSQPSRAWWMQSLNGQKVLYAQYNQVQSADVNEGRLVDFANVLVQTFEEQDLKRVVLDLRLNGGGDNTTFGPLIQAIQASERLDRRGNLYALISRQTFSAAGNFVTVLERDTNAILVGQPTGGAPNQYGDARRLTLPHFPWLQVSIATRYHVFGIDGDERVTHEPELMVPMTAADYFTQSDPVLETALNDQPDAR